MPLGAVCNHQEYAVCPIASICAKVPGVITVPNYPGTGTWFCLRPVAQGGVCGNRFRDSCIGGAYCIGGKCRKADKAPPAPKPRLAGFGGFCRYKFGKCAPGMTCREKTCGTNCRENTCELITVPGKAWDKCTSTATKNIACEKGTACMRGIEWVGIRRCRPVGGVGAYCDSFYFQGKQRSRCRGSLKSGYSVRGDFLWKRTCYDPVKVLPPGARCNPKLSKCVARTFSRAINCSSKGSHFAFQFDAYHLDSQVEQ